LANTIKDFGINMESTLIKLETQYNLLKAKIDAAKDGKSDLYIDEKDIENYFKTYQINGYEDLQYMVNFFIKRAFSSLDDL